MWTSTGMPGVSTKFPATRFAPGEFAVSALPGPSGPSIAGSTSYQERPGARCGGGGANAEWTGQAAEGR